MQSEDDRGARPRYYAIKDGKRYYVALALLDYNPAAADTDEKRDGVKAVGDMFDKAVRSSELYVADVSQEFGTIGPMNTGPFPV